MNILAIGAHPDDIEILCAGTLARYAEQGHTSFEVGRDRQRIAENKRRGKPDAFKKIEPPDGPVIHKFTLPQFCPARRSQGALKN